MGSTVAADPGDGSSITFGALGQTFGGTFQYTYYVSADVAADATGSVKGVITSTSSIGATVGSGTGRPSNESLSLGSPLLPVALSEFSLE